MNDKTIDDRLRLLEEKVEGLLYFTSKLIMYGDLSNLTIRNKEAIDGLNKVIVDMRDSFKDHVDMRDSFKDHIWRTKHAFSQNSDDIKALIERMKNVESRLKNKEDGRLDPILLKPIDEVFDKRILGMKRILNGFLAENIILVQDLMHKTKSELLRIPNFGTHSLRMTENELAKFGLTLRDY